VSDPGLALARLFDFDVLLPEDLGAAHFLNADGFRHGAILSRRSLPSAGRRGPPVNDQDMPRGVHRPASGVGPGRLAEAVAIAVLGFTEEEHPVLLPIPLVDPDAAQVEAAPIESPKTPAF